MDKNKKIIIIIAIISIILVIIITILVPILIKNKSTPTPTPTPTSTPTPTPTSTSTPTPIPKDVCNLSEMGNIIIFNSGISENSSRGLGLGNGTQLGQLITTPKEDTVSINKVEIYIDSSSNGDMKLLIYNVDSNNIPTTQLVTKTIQITNGYKKIIFEDIPCKILDKDKNYMLTLDASFNYIMFYGLNIPEFSGTTYYKNNISSSWIPINQSQKTCLSFNVFGINYSRNTTIDSTCIGTGIPQCGGNGICTGKFCFCNPGYTGTFCKSKCDFGFSDENCTYNPLCINLGNEFIVYDKFIEPTGYVLDLGAKSVGQNFKALDNMYVDKIQFTYSYRIVGTIRCSILTVIDIGDNFILGDIMSQTLLEIPPDKIGYQDVILDMPCNNLIKDRIYAILFEMTEPLESFENLIVIYDNSIENEDSFLYNTYYYYKNNFSRQTFPNTRLSMRIYGKIINT